MKIGEQNRDAALESERFQVSVTIDADWICGECARRLRGRTI
jgi:hypothetical protein